MVVAAVELLLNAQQENPVVVAEFARYEMHSAFPPDVEVMVTFGAAENALAKVTAIFPTVLLAPTFPTVIDPVTIFINP